MEQGWTDPTFLPPEQRWANPRFPLIEGSHRSSLDEYTLSIARCLGYTGAYIGKEEDDAGFLRVMDFLSTFKDEARTLIFDVIVVCSEHGPLSDAELERLKNGVMTIENGRASPHEKVD